MLAADADRRTIERELHSGVHQYLVALATTVQLARRAADSDPAAVNALLDEMERDVRRALDETALLAQRIYPSALELGGLAALLRSAAVQAGVPATVDVAADSSYAPEIAMTVYLCWLAALASGKSETQVTIGVGEVDDTLSFELAAEAPGCGFRPVAGPRRGSRRQPGDRVRAGRNPSLRLAASPEVALTSSRPGRGRRP